MGRGLRWWVSRSLVCHCLLLPCRSTVKCILCLLLQGCVIEDSLLMGADYYEQYEECEAFTVRLRAHMCGVFGRVPLCPADKGEE